MVSEKGAHKDDFDERLVEARDSVLLAGEQVIAQEVGDQGQAIVLTESRIIILKVGITATGMLNGRKTGVYPLGQVTNITVRKGPMGAVVQVFGQDPTEREPGEKPESLVVFGFPDKIKRCDGIAAKLEAAWGKPIERVEPKPEITAASEAKPDPAPEPTESHEAPGQVSAAAEPTPEPEAANAEPKARKPRGGRVAKSLAEEMFAEMSPAPSVAEPVVVAKAVAEPVVEPPVEVVPEIVTEPIAPIIEALPEEPKPMVVEAVIPEAQKVVTEIEAAPAPRPEPEPAPSSEPAFRPNPNLPKPMRRKSNGPSKVLLLVGGLGVLAVLGIAIMGPLRQQPQTAKMEVDVTQLTNSVTVLRQHYIAASKYKQRMLAILKDSGASAAAVRSALGSGNHQSVLSALNADTSDRACAMVNELKAPLGLAGARESISSGLFIRKSAIDAALTGSVSTAETIRKLAEADRLIAKGTLAIDSMLADIESRMPKAKHRNK